ncbi:MAG TPA: hypothetical protein PK511_10170 [Chitinophagales bacterium]|nr:hypothetical protein [Chitinophagales bacterium]HMZ89415.1 hypothetical protein [Chitinophagales bacterium]HNE46151.1 hypothetical protein [Chitinophagales bacterium]HNF68246.1 hypothetical protein [Chitinophagales bacterium]HNI54877.1 hypothetical protein [Chitinophagales bacterium]
MRKSIVAFLLLLISTASYAQKSDKEITPEDMTKLLAYQDTLKWIGDSVVQSPHWEMREQSCIIFLKMLKTALKTPNSYQFAFDSVPTMSVVNAPDNTFRILTWQMQMKDHSHRYYGAIQRNSSALDITPLIDMSMFIGNPEDTLLSANSWYGCLYYNITQKKYKGKTYYFLFGWDGNDMWSNKKMVDVLTFNEMGVPMFGYPMFLAKDDINPQTRIIIEYKEDASPVLNYDEQLKMIVISYLRPENPMSEGIYFTYIPDGTYVGFYFKRGLWRYKDQVFDRTMDAPPDYTPKREGENPNIYKNE